MMKIWNKPRGSDNSVIRDRDEYFVPKNKKSMKDFVDEVVKNADRILDKYTKEYDIDDDYDLEMELRDVLRKIFISLASTI